MHIRFPIGDWSGDGHRECDWYIVFCETTVTKVAEAHNKCSGLFGFDIGDMCREYEDSKLSPEIVGLLLVAGILAGEYCEDAEYMQSEELLELWLAILNKIDSTLKLKNITKDFASIHSQPLSINVPGYGVFG